MKDRSKISSQNTSGAMRPVDVYFKKYNSSFSGSTQLVLLSILCILFYLGFIGIIWTIPFPHLKFLGNYNGYFNWASFIIAGLIFYWYKQSPLLSYFLLVLIFSITYMVTSIEAAYYPGVIYARVIFTAMLVVALFGLVKMASKRDLDFFKALLFIPPWLIHFITKRLKVNY